MVIINDEIILKPQWLLNNNNTTPDWKNGCKGFNIYNGNKINTKHNKKDYWGSYSSPCYDERHEYINKFPVYNNIASLYEKDNIMWSIIPLYKHLLRGEDFYKFYIKKNSNVYNKSLDILDPEIIINSKKTSTIRLQQLVNYNDELYDDDTLIEEVDNIIMSDNENNDIVEYSDYEDYEES
jgi:hypothetical protein